MTPHEFAQWAFVLTVTAAFALGITAAAIALIGTGIGSVIEWFDKRKRRAEAYRQERKEQ